MIPKSSGNIRVNEAYQFSKTYALDFDKKRIVGSIDDLDAVVQSVKKIFQTERYSELIYSSEYGVELWSLVGRDMPYIEASIALRISDSLTSDIRIKGVRDVSVSKVDSSSVSVSFIVETIYGEAKLSGSYIKV